MKWLYELIYRYELPAWDMGPRKELVDFIRSAHIQPCEAVCLGSGTANNAIFLAQEGFNVTGIDYAKSAIELGRKRASKAGVEIQFVEDDLTRLHHLKGTFELLVDFGTFDDLNATDRELYVENILPLTHKGSLFFLWCFEWPRRWWERLYPFPMSLQPGEVQERFGSWFQIERLDTPADLDLSKFQPGSATYLMTREPR